MLKQKSGDIDIGDKVEDILTELKENIEKVDE